MKNKAGIILVFFLSATIFLLTFSVFRLERDRQKGEFKQEAQVIFDSLKFELENTKTLLYAFNGLFLSSEHVLREEFQQFNEILTHYFPGIQAVEWAPRVSYTEKEAYEREGKKFKKHFAITEVNPEGKVIPVTTKQEYFPVFYVEPYLGNEQALGLDLASEKKRHLALKSATERKGISVTGKIDLIQGGGSGFLMLFPVYQNNILQGYLVVVQRIEAIIDTILTPKERKKFDIAIFEDISRQNLLYGKLPNLRHPQTDYSLQLGQKTWTVVISLKTGLNILPPYQIIGLIFLSIVVIFSFSWYLFKLEILVRNRTQQLNLLRKKAETANQAKSEFLSTISHEIRTPLTTILGYTERIKEELAHTNVDQAILEKLNIIYLTGNHLGSVIGDVLDFAKVDAGKLTIKEALFDLKNLPQHLVNAFLPEAEKKGLKFTVEEATALPQKVIGDKTRINQVLFNLCNNAIKFTETGRIHVSLGFNKKKSELWWTVSDTGVGIPPQKREKIFTPFYQTDTTAEKQHIGTGLGLTISRKICRRLHGDLSVVDSDTFSTVFKGFIKVKLIDEAKFVETKQSLMSFSAHVLLAEDSPTTREVIVWQLEKFGLKNIVTVPNGQKALQAVKKEKFDLIFMDIQMPILDGIATVKKLRQEGCQIPIVALTAGMIEDPKYLETGFNDVLGKPFKIEALQKILKKHLEDEKNLLENEDNKKLENLVLQFLESLPKQADKLEIYIKKHNFKEIQFLLHKLRGTCMHCKELNVALRPKFLQIIDLAEKSEYLLEEGNEGKALAILPKLLKLLRQKLPDSYWRE